MNVGNASSVQSKLHITLYFFLGSIFISEHAVLKGAICKKSWFLSLSPSSSNNDALGFPLIKKWHVGMAADPSYDPQSVSFWRAGNETQKSTFVRIETFKVWLGLGTWTTLQA